MGAVQLNRADGTPVDIPDTDAITDKLNSCGADLNLYDLRRRFLDDDHPRSRHQPSEPPVGTWHGDEDGATISLTKLAAVTPANAAKDEIERNAEATVAWAKANSLMRAANVASMAAGAAWICERHPDVAEVEINVALRS